jgi:predicted nucleotidyltransferase
MRTRLKLADVTRQALADELRVRLPSGTVVWVFGSLVRRGVFNAASDVDIALESEPAGLSCFRLSSELEEALGRPVDVVLLNESRLAVQIQSTGDKWTL